MILLCVFVVRVITVTNTKMIGVLLQVGATNASNKITRKCQLDCTVTLMC